MNDATFTLFNVDGMTCHFNVEIDILATKLQQLVAAGWRVTQPTGDARPNVERAVGWVLSEWKDGTLGKMMPCVHLYSQYGDFKQITVYHERLAELPFTVEEKKEAGKHKWNGVAPKREDAMQQGYMMKCDFEFIMETCLDSEGNPLKTEAGNIKYKFGGVRGQQQVETQHLASTQPQAATNATVTVVRSGGVYPAEPPSEPEIDFYPPDFNPFDEPSPKANGNGHLSDDDKALIQAREIIQANDIVELPKMHVWAVSGGYRTNEHSSRNEWMAMLKAEFGGSVTRSNQKQAIEAFVARCLKGGVK